MKAKLILSVLLLGLVSSSIADTVIGDFEGGSMDGWWAAGWNAGDYAVPVEAYPTVGTWSMEGHIANGGWNEVMEVALLDRPSDGLYLKSILAQGGKVSVDVTSFYNTGSSNDYSQLCILVNCNGLWDVYGYVGVQNGVTETVVFDLPQAARDALAAATEYANIGILSNHSPTESYFDEILQETVITFDGAITHYMDNIQIIVPEPASLALLGLGSLSLLRRKR